MLHKYIDNVRAVGPRIHCITNYVTANDVANILLACGASPILADAEEEAEDIAGICSGVCLNMGTLNPGKLRAMIKAGKRANELGRPVILDPVGVSSSAFRKNSARTLLEEVRFTAVRGNISEIKTLALESGGAAGVDAAAADRVTEENLPSVIAFAKRFSSHTGAVIIISGEIDIVCSAEKAYVIKNGHLMMSRITGSGCMLSALTAAFIAANPENVLSASAAAVITMGICGEAAYERMAGTADGTSTFRTYLIDAVSNADGDNLERRAKYEIC